MKAHRANRSCLKHHVVKLTECLVESAILRARKYVNGGDGIVSDKPDILKT
jgi:hypothetical protein